MGTCMLSNRAKVDAVDHPAAVMIVVMSRPDFVAAEVEAERVLWAPN